jgi:hypothetical protein
MDFFCGGYFLTKRTRRSLVTLSPQQASFFPDVWAVSWTGESMEARAAAAAALDIPAADLPVLIAKVTQRHREEGTFLWPNVIASVSAARKLLALVTPTPGWLLLGIGVEETEAASLLTRGPVPRVGVGGVLPMLGARAPLEPGFRELGYDLIELVSGQIENDQHDFDVRQPLNADGLFTDYDSAERVAAALGSGPDFSHRLAIAKVVAYDVNPG